MKIKIYEDNFIGLIIVLFVITFLLLSGCNSKISSDSSIPINAEEQKGRASLQTAINTLNADDGMRMGRLPPYTIHNVIGRNISPDGRAESWIISVHSQEPFYFVHTPERFYSIRWIETERDRAIDFEKEMSPDELFSKQTSLFSSFTVDSESSIDELQLRNGIYHISGHQRGKLWEYSFDSTTGKQLSEEN